MKYFIGKGACSKKNISEKMRDATAPGVGVIYGLYFMRDYGLIPRRNIIMLILGRRLRCLVFLRLEILRVCMLIITHSGVFNL
jgi:hypothetical protein